jgi:hypothetical protein
MTTTEPMVASPLPPGLDTPALVIDLDVVERNARRLADPLAARAVALRPHVKTHKSVALARIQLDAGAAGITVGNLGEAEVFAAGGIDDIFIAYPIWVEGPKAERLRALAATRGLRLRVGFDSIEGARRLAEAIAAADRRLEVVLELDPGNRRIGAPPGRAGEIARAARSFGLEPIGVFTPRRSRLRAGPCRSRGRGRGALDHDRRRRHARRGHRAPCDQRRLHADPAHRRRCARERDASGHLSPRRPTAVDDRRGAV